MERYLEKCVFSLLDQDYENYRIVLVENGSTKDDTRGIIRRFEQAYDRVDAIYIDHNQQYGNALELAIRQCQSEFFIICDPDDTLEKDALRRLAEQSEGRDMVCGSRYLFYEGSAEKTYDSCINEAITTLRKGEVRPGDDLFKDLFFLDPTPHSKLYRTEKVKDIVIPKETFTDNVLYFKALLEADCVYYDSSLCVANYLTDRSGNSTTTLKPGYIRAFTVMSKGLLSNALSSSHYEQFREIFALRLYLSLKTMIDTLHRIKGEKKELYEVMEGLYDALMPYLLENRKGIFRECNRSKYYTVQRYDQLLLEPLLSKGIYKRSIRKIIEGGQS